MAGTPPVIFELRQGLAALANPEHARFHQAYHKSSMPFYGLRTPQLRQLWRQLWPSRTVVSRDVVLPLLDPLWRASYEESITALYLLSRAVKQLGPADLPLLLAQTRRCQGWGQLDFLALEVLGPLALAHGADVYQPVLEWLEEEWMWTRRSALLIHIIPARRKALALDYAWPSLVSRLAEKEFFIRKAVGWTLAECSKHYAAEVAEFVRLQRASMSGLSYREAIRRLPVALLEDTSPA